MGHLPPKCRHQPGQLKQVLQAKRRAAGRDGHHGIERNPIGPAGRDRDQPPLLVTVIVIFALDAKRDLGYTFPNV